MVRSRRAGILAVGLVAALAAAALSLRSSPGPLPLDQGRVVAPGVVHHQIAVDHLTGSAERVALNLLELDPREVRLDTVLAHGAVRGRETVAEMARQTGALAAINAGFFLPDGQPQGIFKTNGVLVTGSRLGRGAVAIVDTGESVDLLFDRIHTSPELEIVANDGPRLIPLDAIGRAARGTDVILYPDRYAPRVRFVDGTAWQIDPSSIVRARHEGPVSLAIEPGHRVLWVGGALRPPFDELTPGMRVRLHERYGTSRDADDRRWTEAPHVVGGAGLLIAEGEPVDSWAHERLTPGFVDERHPRTLIGTDRDRRVWLATADGRQPGWSAGLTLAETRRLAEQLGLVNALNLDGGGSTTMVVNGRIVNRPSDPTGPRPVSDAILVLPRR